MMDISGQEQFGRFDSDTNAQEGGLDIIRFIPENELNNLKTNSEIPKHRNMLCLILYAGAARAQRGKENEPSTMLLHVSHLILNK
jgi:hypothetical protein